MNRRDFFRISASGIAALAVSDALGTAVASERKRKGESYSIVMLGDTHYDAAPFELYHTGYSDPKPEREALHRSESARNADMWQDRCPRLVKRAACLAGDDTKMFFQLGDLIQGDTGDYDTHVKFLDDAMTLLKGMLGPLPLVTVAGNHDLRAADDKVALRAYTDYMPGRMSEELGQRVDALNFMFRIGKDAYIVVDFNHPDDAAVEALFDKAEGARYTFVIIHSPVLPYSSVKYGNWIYHGRKQKTPEARLHMREVMARHNAIVICGHSHTTEFARWEGFGGSITQMTINSVWKEEKVGTYNVSERGVEAYAAIKQPGDDRSLVDEVLPGMKEYVRSNAAGSYRMKVSDEGVTMEVYAGDSTFVSDTFRLR